MNGGEDGRHRDIDPHVDWPELVLDPFGCRFDRVGVGDVGGNRQGPNTVAPEGVSRFGEPIWVARQKGDVVAVFGELLDGRAPDTGAGSSNYDDLRHIHLRRNYEN